MNISLVTVLVATLIFVSNVGSHGINVKKLISAVLEALDEKAIEAAVCASGYNLTISGDLWDCVATSENEEVETKSIDVAVQINSTFNIADDCPATGCPPNPGCNKGFQLVTYEENCCCVKLDEAKSKEDKEFEKLEDETQVDKPEEEPEVTIDAVDSEAPSEAANPEVATNENVVIVLAPDCPSFGCPENATCSSGYDLLTHGSNCCCVKLDEAAKSEEKQEEKP